MTETTDLLSVTSWLDECHQPLVLSHRRPDADALGSMAAMTVALKRRGKNPIAMLYEPLPAKYAFLQSAEFEWYEWELTREAAQDSCDAVVIVDTCALSQLEPVAAYLSAAPRTLVLDHHATRDPIATRDGDLRYFDETAAAACLIVFDWLRAAKQPLDAYLAQALFAGTATDTGWFRFSNTDERAFRCAADLVAAGARPSEIYAHVYQQDTPTKLKLVGRLLDQLELLADGRLAVMRLRADDFAATGADQTMTEDLVNEAARLRGTEVTILFTEEGDDIVRLNLRSRNHVNVADLARRYGGGGHARAAGARLRGPWDAVVPRVIDEAISML